MSGEGSHTADAAGDNRFISFHRSMPEKPDTTVRFFDRSDYYTVHGPDALFAAKQVFRTLAVVKYWGKERLPSVSVSKMNFESMMRDLLLVRQYRVEVYRCQPKSQTWVLTGKASPGNLQQFEDLLFGGNDMASAAGVVAIKTAQSEGARVIGVAYADATLRQLGVCEFADNDQFSNLESLLVQIGPKECVLPSGDQCGDFAAIRQILKRSNILITDRKRGEFNTKDIVQDLNRLLKATSASSSASLPEMDLQHAMAAVAPLIKYLELLTDESNFGQFTLRTLSLEQYMKLDAAAARALSLLPSEGDRTAHHSLLGLLNKCRTAQGQRLLAQWIKQPLLDLNKIEERLNLVEMLVDIPELRQALQEEHLRRIPDFCRLAKRVQRQKASLQDLVRIYQALKRLPSLIGLMDKFTNCKHATLWKEQYTNPLTVLEHEFENFVQLVQHTIDLDQVANHEFLIRASFDENLQECREQMDALLEQLPDVLQKAARTLGLEANKTVKLESTTQLGHFFRVTRKDEKALRNVKGFTTLDAKQNGVRFVNARLKDINTELQQLTSTYNELQSSLAAEVLKIACGYAEPLLTLSDVTAHLDAMLSFAHVSANAPIPYTRPKILPKGEGGIRLVSGRHPCLEVQDDVAFIPNDVEFVRGQQMFHIITGPNMGGKSTYIRQTGVIILMAQLGCFVPCQSAEVSIVDSILARVGASDSQLKGVSTFMAEMLETASILRLATSNSLIIIDELGRGTSTYDGFGLAWAISQHIATKIDAFCMFATHFHELTALSETVPAVCNQHVTALTTDNTLTLLYKVKPGVCDQSFGIHVAELAHFPSSVVEFARQKAAELESQSGLGKRVWSGDCDEPEAKRRRLVQEEAEQIMSDFLSQVEGLQANSDQECEGALEKLREQVLAHNNEYISAVLA